MSGRPGNFQSFAGRTHAELQELRGEIEQAATVTRTFECGLVPGLLQVPQYARGVFRRFASLMGLSPGGIDAAVAGRAARQNVLAEKGKSFHFILPQAALETRICPPEDMLAQIQALDDTVSRTNVLLGIIPADAESILPPMHGFTILDDRVVEVELLTGNVEIAEPGEVSRYQDAFNRYEAMAAYGGNAHRLLADAARRHRQASA